jgi:hypothetical protein
MRTPVVAISALAATLAIAASLGATAHWGAPARAASAPAPPPASDFSARVRNPWFPLVPGTRYIYDGIKDGKPSRDVLTVTNATKTIQGVPCAVVHDRLYLGGRLHERTTDWYSQDAAGNVWYFGESTAELDAHGKITSTEGSWTAGVDGARPGIFMPAHPRRGQSYRQEYYNGHAEDHFKIIGVLSGVTAGHAQAALLTREWTPLEPGVVDHKTYVRGIGTVLEQTVKGGDERNELVRITRTR